LKLPGGTFRFFGNEGSVSSGQRSPKVDCTWSGSQGTAGELPQRAGRTPGHVLDPEVLALAADEGRILVSHDSQTMPKHFRQFTEVRHSPGLFLVSQDLPVGRAVESLLLICEASEPDEWANRLQA